MTYQCPQCGLPRTGNQAMGLAMPQCVCSWQFTPPQTPPPKREWVGLTRAECLQIEKDMAKYYDYQHECKTVCLPEFAKAIEAKLREKNAPEQKGS